MSRLSKFPCCQKKPNVPLLSALLFGRGRSEVWVLVRYPIDKFSHARVGQQALDIHPVALQFGISEIGDQRLLANGMHGHNIAPAAALGHGMVPDNGLAWRPAAKPAGYRHRRSLLLLAMQVSVGITIRMFAGHASVLTA